MKKLAYVMAGFLAGLLVIGTATAFAKTADLIGKVYWNKDVNILFDGETRILTGDYVVMNYLDYNYTSARFIAEGLGAKVEYDEKTNSIKVKSQEHEKVVYEELNAEGAYLEAPIKYEDKYIEMTVNGFLFGSYPILYYTIENVVDKPNFDYEKAYIDYEGKKYYARYDNRIDWVQDLGTVSEAKLEFDEVKIVNSDEVKVVIPYGHSQSSEGEHVELLLKLPKIEIGKE